eukprot:scaffold5753_cov122-Isochrysis_galbana.AAC.3
MRLYTGRPQCVPASLTSVCACLADASAERAMAALSAVLRAREKLGTRSTGCTLQGMTPGGVSNPQTASEAQPGRLTARSGTRWLRRRTRPSSKDGQSDAK